MDIQSLTEEIRTKLAHTISVKTKSYSKTISELDEDEQEEKMSTYITDITFQVSEKVIKDKLAKFNPKPHTFQFHIDPIKYYHQTLGELLGQLTDEIKSNEEILKSELETLKDTPEFIIEFTGHFLKDYGFIGQKIGVNNDFIKTVWFPSILRCLDKNGDTTAEDLVSLREFISIGFSKAINQTYVFVDDNKIIESLKTLNYVSTSNGKMSPEEFDNYRKNISFKK